VDCEAGRVSPVASLPVAEGTRVPTTVPVVCRPPTRRGRPCARLSTATTRVH